MAKLDFKALRNSESMLVGFFIEKIGAPVSKAGRFHICPICGEASSHNGKISIYRHQTRGMRWHCHSCDFDGDVIDAAEKYFNARSEYEAAAMLSDLRHDTDTRRCPLPVLAKPKRDQEAIKLVITKLLDAQTSDPDKVVVEYLESRGIRQELVEEAVQRKFLVTLPGNATKSLRFLLDLIGKDLLDESGIWKEGSQCPAIVYRPLAFVSADKRSIEFRQVTKSEVSVAKAIRYGASAPAVWQGNGNFMITEAPIDSLSAVVLGSQRTIITLPGAKSWHEDDDWVLGLAGKNVLLALDFDITGDESAEKLTSVLVGLGAKVSRHQLPAGAKDLNDELCLSRVAC